MIIVIGGQVLLFEHPIESPPNTPPAREVLSAEDLQKRLQEIPPSHRLGISVWTDMARHSEFYYYNTLIY